MVASAGDLLARWQRVIYGRRRGDARAEQEEGAEEVDVEEAARPMYAGSATAHAGRGSYGGSYDSDSEGEDGGYAEDGAHEAGTRGVVVDVCERVVGRGGGAHGSGMEYGGHDVQVSVGRGARGSEPRVQIRGSSGSPPSYGALFPRRQDAAH